MIFEKIRGRLQKKWQSYMDEYGMIDIKIQEVFVEIRNIINQVETEYNNGWIRCEDKLPETLDSYLVVVKMKYKWETEWEYQTDVAYYTMEDGYIDGWNTFNDWNEGQECHIVYWQPLPQPPKGE